MTRVRLSLKRFTALLAAAALLAGGCSHSRSVPSSDVLTETEPQADASPQFWEYASAVSGTDNLYELRNDFFEGKPYNDLQPFGERILFVGQAYYSFLDAETLEELGGDLDSLEYKYSFEVYDPARNEITAALGPDDIRCDIYQVLGDRLMLLDLTGKKCSFYNTELQLLNTYDAASFIDDCSLTFYPSEDPDVLYTFSGDEVLTLTFGAASVTVGRHTLDCLNVFSAITSHDGGRMAYAGIDPVTLQYTTYVTDSVLGEPVFKLPSDDQLTGSISDHASVFPSDYSSGYWTYQHDASDFSYFYLPDVQEASLLSDDSMIFRRETYGSEQENYSVSFYRYAPSGEALSSFTYDCGAPASENALYVGRNIAYFPDWNVCFLLLYTVDAHPFLLIWDFDHAGNGATALEYYPSEQQLAQAYPETSLTATLIEDPESYDWGALSDANQHASELEEKYGVSIFLGPEVPSKIDCYDTQQQTDPTVVASALDDLESLFSCYPENFFPQLCFGSVRDIKLYLTGTIASDAPGMLDSPSAFVNEINSSMVMVLDTNYSWDWNYTFNHELSHMIDRRLDFRSSYTENSVYSEEAWNSFNPADSAYLYTYDDYEDYGVYDRYPEYYISSYGLTYPTEDRAEMFGWAMSDYLDGFRYYDGTFRSGNPISDKYRYYCQCIRDGFDTGGWAQTMPWEEVLLR